MLSVMQSAEDAFKLWVFVPDDDRLGMVQNRINAVDHKPRYVWNAIEDEVPIGPDQACHIYVSVKNAQVIALADEAFDDLNHGTLSQIVRPGFETKTQNSYPPVFLLRYELQPFRNLHFVAWQDRVHDRQVQIVAFGLIREST